MTDTATTPHGTDDSGAPIESVTVEASRLPNWWIIGGVLAACATALYYFGEDDNESDEE